MSKSTPERAHLRKYPELWDEQWLRDRIEKQSGMAIAEELGCSFATVHKAAQRFKIDLPKREPRPAHNAIPWEAYIGQRFGLLVVVDKVDNPGSSGNTCMLAHCDCGGSKVVHLNVLVNRTSGWDHCGCLSLERRQASMRKGQAVRAAKPRVNDGTCSFIGGCERPAQTRGLCGKHYREFQAESNPGCAVVEDVERCGKVVVATELQLCSTHYRRLKLYDDVLFRQDPHEKRVEKTKSGYRAVCRNGVTRQEHTWVMMDYLKRDLLPIEEVHHKNGEKDDNRLENLELWDKAHPSGQRVEDKVKWCREYLALYGDMFPEDA